jgi:hypothetical protein
MSLTFWRRNKEPSAAERARIKAERDLAATRAETPKYRDLARSFIEIREVNHLGQTAAQVLRGEKP